MRPTAPRQAEALQGLAPRDAQVREAILGLLRARAPGATVCPSEVARVLAPGDWRPLMPQVRAVALAMARDAALEIRQAGRRVPPDAPLRGPIRLAAPERADGGGQWKP